MEGCFAFDFCDLEWQCEYSEQDLIPKTSGYMSLKEGIQK